MNITTIRRPRITCALLFWTAAVVAILTAMSARVTAREKDDNVRVVSGISTALKLPPRLVPAKITHENDYDLVKEGYYMLGKVEVSVTKGGSQRLWDRLLKEAASYGGDLVVSDGDVQHFTDSHTATVPESRLQVNKKGYLINAPTGGEEDRIVQEKVKYIVGWVYRYDAQRIELAHNLAAAARDKDIQRVTSLLQQGASIETYD